MSRAPKPRPRGKVRRTSSRPRLELLEDRLMPGSVLAASVGAGLYYPPRW